MAYYGGFSYKDSFQSLHDGFVPTDLNETFLICISKKRKHEQLSECRLIGLFNVVYKVTAKVIANRLKLILPHVI